MIQHLLLFILFFLALRSNAQTFYFSAEKNKIHQFNISNCSKTVVCTDSTLDNTFRQLVGVLTNNKVIPYKYFDLETYDLKSCTTDKFVFYDPKVENDKDTLLFHSNFIDQDNWIWSIGDWICKFNPYDNQYIYKGKPLEFKDRIKQGNQAKYHSLFQYKGNFYFLERDGIIKLDTNEISNSKLLFPCTECWGHPPSGTSIDAICSVRNSCDEDRVFCFIHMKGLYEINMETGEFILVCSIERDLISGMFSLRTLAPHSCDLVFDLDRDNSSGKINSDYFTEESCTHQLTICDQDLYLYTDFVRVDSVLIDLENGIQDGDKEEIIFPSSSKIDVKRISFDKYALYGKQESNYSDMRNVIVNAIYRNNAPNYKFGVRTLLITAFVGQLKQTAYSYLELKDGNSRNKIEIDSSICLGDTINIQGKIISKSGDEYFIYKNNIGCDSTVIYHIQYRDENLCNCEIRLPNIITPNGDKINSELGIVNLCDEKFQTLQFEIYNRWGKLIYKTTDHQFRWNPIDAGLNYTETYIYYLRYQLNNASVPINKKGLFTVVY